MSKNKCTILFPSDDFDDVSGCLKEECHNDSHVCKDKYGILYEWEDDYGCQCGCWDEWERSNGMSHPCMIYSKITDKYEINKYK